MKTFDRNYLRNMLNRCYPEEGLSRVPKESLDFTHLTNGDWNPIRSALEAWEAEGKLVILKDPESAEPNEICVRIITFLNGDPFPEDWIRD